MLTIAQTAAEPIEAGQIRALAGARIAILNWRGDDHPKAGGAEQYAWSVARLWAAAGAHVTYVTARHGRAKRQEIRDGVRIVRGGGEFGVYPAAAAWLLLHRRALDMVLDCQNGIPFFSPIFTRGAVPTTLLVHHVHQDQFSVHYPAPMARLGRWLEGPASRRVYGRLPIVAVSPSTRLNVRRRLRLRGPIFVVPNGSTPPEALGPPVQRSATPVITSVGRLVPHKRYDLFIKAVARIRAEIPDLQVHVVGDGPAFPELAELVTAVELDGVVKMHGRLPDAERDALLRCAWLTVQPSAAEGWGLTVIEAARYGVPTLGFRAPGLVDSIQSGRTGWLVDEPSAASEKVAALADSIRDAVTNELQAPAGRALIAAACREWAGHFTWNSTAERAALVMLHGHEHWRSSGDVAVVVHLHGVSATSLALNITNNRPLHLLRRDGDCLEVLLYGLDESGARHALADWGIDHSTCATLRVASQEELLVGPLMRVCPRHASRRIVL